MQHYKIQYAYWGMGEFFAALFPKRGALENFHSKLKSITHSDNIILLNSGRTAIRIALKVMKSSNPDRKQVIVPAFSCDAVFEAIKAEGLEIRLVDVDENLNLSIDKLKQQNFDDVLAVVAEHCFGLPLDMETICALSAKHKFFVIDDSAHIQKIKYRGRYMGGYGDFGINSFAQSKTMVGGRSSSGGALIINNPDFVASAHKYAQELQESKNTIGEFIFFVWVYLWEHQTRAIRHYFTTFFRRPDTSQIVGMSRMNSTNAAILLCQYEKLDKIIEGKKHVVQLYKKIANEFPRIELVQKISEHYIIKLNFKIPTNMSVETVFQALKQENIQARRPYDIHWTKEYPNSENANAIADHMIELPTTIGMTEHDVRSILTVFQKVIS